MSTSPEVWLRGPIEGMPAAVMPAAHAFLQTLEESERICAGLTDDELWASPGGVNAVGWHLLHLSGSTDRLLTYARGERLNAAQKEALALESAPPRTDASTLLASLRRTIDAACEQLRATPANTLYEVRTVGRAALPTTVVGLLFHAAEHSQRHAGQIVTTAALIRGERA